MSPHQIFFSTLKEIKSLSRAIKQNKISRGSKVRVITMTLIMRMKKLMCSDSYFSFTKNKLQDFYIAPPYSVIMDDSLTTAHGTQRLIYRVFQ